MKKFVVLLVVMAMTCLSAVAYAMEVTVGGEVSIRSRDFSDLKMYEKLAAPGNQRDTQERFKIDVSAKADGVSGKISIWNYWDTWGRFEAPQANGAVAATPAATTNRIAAIESWIAFDVPGVPVNVKVGHQMLQLGHGWFFRSMYFGSDAWLVSNHSGNNTLAFVDVKFGEGATGSADDTDAYVLLDVLKLNDNNTVGIDLTNLKDRKALFANAAFGAAGREMNLQNIGLNYTGKLGPLALKAQVDVQMGKYTNPSGVVGDPDPKFKGNEIVVQGTVNLDAVAVNFTLAQGSGQKSGDKDVKQFITALDINPRYTFLYEYKIPTAAGAVNQGFSNTTAIGVGASANVSKSLNVGADIWLLSATQKTNVTQTGAGAGAESDKIGTELDVKVNWKLYDNLAWNWALGYFKPGDAYKDVNGKGTDAATGIQGILSLKF